MSVADQGSAAPILRRLPFTIRLSPQMVNGLARQDAPPTLAAATGLLFGMEEEGLLVVQSSRALPSSSANGSGAEARGSKEALIRREVQAAQEQAAPASLQLVGWYVKHPQGGLLPGDIEFHQAHFPRLNAVALVVKAEGPESVTLEVYCRTTAGVLAEDSYRIGVVRLSGDKLESPVEVMPRPKIRDDFFMQAYTVGDPDTAVEPSKSSLALFSRQVIASLRPKHKEKNTAAESPKAVEARPPATPLLPPPAAADHSSLPAPLSPLVPAPPPLALVHSPVALPRSRSKLLVPTLFLATAAGTMAAVYYVRTAQTVPGFLQFLVPHTVLGLKVETQGDRLLISWNRQQPVILHARSGDLLIADGSFQRHVTLDNAHVANGSILYRPNSDDVTFRLNIVSDNGQEVTETMRVLDAGKPTVLDVTPPGVPPVLPSANSQPTRSKTAPQARVPLLLPERNSTSPNGATPAAPVLDKQSSLARETPDQALKAERALADKPTSAVPDSVAANKPEGATPNSNQGAALESFNATPEEPTQAKPSAPLLSREPPPTTHVEPATTTPQLALNNPPAPAMQKPAIPAARSSNPLPLPPNAYQPPRPVRQVLPNIYSLPAGVAAMTGQIELMVDVDETGRVTGVTPTTSGRKLNAALVGSAVSAARQWKFEPGLLRGKPVKSQHSILFQFTPKK